jgi:hypothetical protein
VLRDDLTQGGSVADVDDADLRPLRTHILDYSNQRARAHDFDAARQCSTLAERIHEEIAARQAAKLVKSQQKRQQHDKALGLARERHQQELDEFERDWRDREAKLKEKHEREVQEFDELWARDKPPRYRKSSTTLLEMKQIERSAILVRDYIKARQLKKEIDSRTQLEHRAQQRRLNEDRQEERRQLFERQQKEADTLATHKIQERDTIERRHTRDLDVLEKRKAAVEIQFKEGRYTRELSGDALHEEYWVRSRGRPLEIDPLLPPLSPPTEPQPKKQKNPRKIAVKSTTFHPLTMPEGTDNDPRYSTRKSRRGPRKTFRYATTTRSESSQSSDGEAGALDVQDETGLEESEASKAKPGIADVVEPNEAVDVTEPNEAADVTEPNEAADVTKPNEAADVTKPNEAADVTEPNEAVTETHADAVKQHASEPDESKERADEPKYAPVLGDVMSAVLGVPGNAPEGDAAHSEALAENEVVAVDNEAKGGLEQFGDLPGNAAPIVIAVMTAVRGGVDEPRDAESRKPSEEPEEAAPLAGDGPSVMFGSAEGPERKADIGAVEPETSAEMTEENAALPHVDGETVASQQQEVAPLSDAGLRLPILGVVERLGEVESREQPDEHNAPEPEAQPDESNEGQEVAPLPGVDFTPAVLDVTHGIDEGEAEAAEAPAAEDAVPIGGGSREQNEELEVAPLPGGAFSMAALDVADALGEAEPEAPAPERGTPADEASHEQNADQDAGLLVDAAFSVATLDLADALGHGEPEAPATEPTGESTQEQNEEQKDAPLPDSSPRWAILSVAGPAEQAALSGQSDETQDDVAEMTVLLDSAVTLALIGFAGALGGAEPEAVERTALESGFGMEKAWAHELSLPEDLEADGGGLDRIALQATTTIISGVIERLEQEEAELESVVAAATSSIVSGAIDAFSRT